jgi:hypothetical protein
MANKVTWKCPHCGKDDGYVGTFSVGFGFDKFYHYHPAKDGQATSTEGKSQSVECGECKKSYLVRLETRVVAAVAPVGEFVPVDQEVA